MHKSSHLSAWVRRAALPCAFIGLAFLAFGPELNAPFDFDDGPAITENTSIRPVWPPRVALRTLPLGTAVSERPAANYSFAPNYAPNRWLGVARSDNPTAYVFAGRALQTIGRFAGQVYLERAVQLNPSEPQALTRLGMAEASMGHSADAARLFQRVLAIMPGYPLARQALEQLGRSRAAP